LFSVLQICFSLLLIRICFTADQLLWVSSSSPLLRVDLWTAVLADDVDGAGGRRTAVGRLMERELVCQLWAEAAAAGEKAGSVERGEGRTTERAE
jgi:hypothetical protein